MDKDLQQIDLFLVIGTSLKVEPVASIIERVPYKVPKILINKDPILIEVSIYNCLDFVMMSYLIYVNV